MYARKVGVVVVSAALFVVATIGVVGANSGFGLLGGSGTDSMYLNGDASHVTTTTVTIDSSVENATEMRLIPPVRFIDANPDGQWTAAIATDGTLWAWGLSNQGQCGIVGAGAQVNPNMVSAESDWTTVTVGESAGYALKSDGSLWAWGGNGNGQLGVGDTVARTTPVRIGAASTWLSVAAGDRHALAIRSDGTLWTWGYNGWGQATGSVSADILSPVQLMVGQTFKSVSVADNSSFAVRADGAMFSWGMNDQGQAGRGDTGGYFMYQFPGTGWSSVSASSITASAIDTSGAVWVWGNNTAGQTGQGTTTPSLQLTPIKVPGLTGVKSVEWANGGAAAQLADGSIRVWGNNVSGQLGLGDTTSRYSPVALMGGRAFDQVTGGAAAMYLRSGSSFLFSGYSTYAAGDPDVGSAVRTVPATVGAGWEPYQASRVATLAAVTGTQTVSVMYRSAAGSETVLSDSIIVDTYAPTGALVINAGERSVRDSEAVLYNTVSGAAFMRYDGGPWHPYSADETYAMSPGDGEKTVTVEFSDEASNTMSVTDTITVDTQPPNGTLTLNSGAATTRNRKVSVAVAGDDAVAMRTPGMGTWQSIFLGNEVLLGIKPDGTLWGTGGNAAGNIGDGTRTGRSSFVPVVNMPPSPFTGIATGSQYTLAVRPDRTLWAWGNNYNGQLGLGTTSDPVATPVAVDGTTTWAKVYAQGDTSFGIKMDGSLWAWGNNSSGQLGIGNTTSPQTIPVRVGGATAYFSCVAPSGTHTLGIKTDGSLWAWGYNYDGQLGNGTTTQLTAPVRIGTANDWQSVSAGYGTSAAIKTDGTLWTWGGGTDGVLGTGSITRSLTPQQVGTDTNWATVDVGGFSVLARKTDGTLWAWGSNAWGQLGDRTKAHRYTPRRVGTRSDWIRAEINQSGTSAALTTDGTLWCWGDNNRRFGDGTSTNAYHPVTGDWLPIATSFNETLTAGDGVKTVEYRLRDEAGNESTVTDSIVLDSTIPTGSISVDGGAQYATSGSITVTNSVMWAAQMRQAPPITSVSAGENFALAVAADGVAYGTGYNYQNQMGAIGPNPKVYTPTFGRRGWSAVSAGYQHSLMIGQDGSLWAVGVGDSGQLGTGSALSTSTPVRIGAATNWISIAAGQNHSAAVNAAGELYVWGHNGWGQVGDGTNSTRYSPVLIGTGYKQVDAGVYYTIAVKNDGSMWAWGMNQYGAFGNGGTAMSYSPTRVYPNSTGWEYVSAGKSHVVALKSDGSAWAWGLGTSGQTTGSSTRLVPVQVGTGFKTVAAGDAHSGGIKRDGTLWMWGSGGSGQLGDNPSLYNFYGPAQIGTETDWSSLSLGTWFSVGLKNDGTIRAWGWNNYSQLGDNTMTQRLTPTQTTLPGWVPYAGSYSATALFPTGSATIWNGFKDEAGNFTYLSDGITFDTLPPVTTHSGVASGWVTAPATVTLSSADDGMGVDSTFYTIDGGASLTYSGPFVVSKEGTTTVAYRSVDKAGRSETTKTVQVRVDTGKPSSNADFSAEWNSDTLSFAPTDTVSGVAATYYRLNSGAVTTFTAPFTVPEGLTDIRYWTVDKAGNTETETALTVRVDLQAPVTGSSTLPEGWVSEEITVTLSPTDVGGGVARTLYSLDGGAPLLYEDPFVIGAGDHVLEYWSEDYAGNIEPRHTASVRVDTVAPETTTSVDDAWHAEPVAVSFLATDPLSGLASTEYRIDGGALTEYLTPFTVFGEGARKLEYRSVDSLGNVETFKTAWIRVDYTAPVTTLAGVPTGPRSMAVELVPSASDAGSGVEQIYYRLNGGQNRPYAADQTAIVVAREGTTTVEYWSVDAVGNTETVKSATVVVDYSEGGGSTVSTTANAPCIQCHGAPTGTQVAVQNFSVTDVDRSTACRKCHTPGLVGTHPNHYAGGNCGAVCHAGQMGQSLLSATPTQLTAYGSFASVASKDLSSDQLHVIHANYRWAADTQYANRKCGSCHARAACTACHTGTLSPAHAQHSAAGNVRYPARIATPSRVGSGIVGEDQTYDSIAVVTQQCGVAECHNTEGLKESAPTAHEDFTHSVIGTTPANTVTTTGKWVPQSGGNYTFGRRSASNTKGSTLSLAFTGTKVAVLGGKSSTFGDAEFLIDGVLVESTSTYSPTNVVRTTLFTSGELVDGPHTITVRVAGTKPAGSSGIAVAVDQFQTWTRLPSAVAPLCGSSCHPGKEVAHGYDGIDHVADSAASIEPVSGARCDACHSMDLLAEHERTGSVTKGGQCQTCHASPRRTFGAWNQTCQQGGCHTPGTTEKRHAGLPSIHRVAVDGTCTRNCHQALLPGEHAKSGSTRAPADCVTCHNSSQYQARARNVVWDGTCVTCHTGSHAPSSAGSQLCLDCHGASAANIDALAGARAWDATTGDHTPGYASSAHGSRIIAGTNDGMPSDVTCEACHNHNAIAEGSVTDFRASGESQRGTALCFECHSDSGDETRTPTPNTWNGRDVAVEFGRRSTHPVVVSAAAPSAATTTRTAFSQIREAEFAVNTLFQTSAVSLNGAQLAWGSYPETPPTKRRLYLFVGWSGGAAQQYDVDTDTWGTWRYTPPATPVAIQYNGQANAVTVDGRIYYLTYSARNVYTPANGVVNGSWAAATGLPDTPAEAADFGLDLAHRKVYYGGHGGNFYTWNIDGDTMTTHGARDTLGNQLMLWSESAITYSPRADRLFVVSNNGWPAPNPADGHLLYLDSPSTAGGTAVFTDTGIVAARSGIQPYAWNMLERIERNGQDYLIYLGLNQAGSRVMKVYSDLGASVPTVTDGGSVPFNIDYGTYRLTTVWDGGDYLYAYRDGSQFSRIRIPADPANGPWPAWEALTPPPVGGMGGSMAFATGTPAPYTVDGYYRSGTVSAEVELSPAASGWGALEWEQSTPARTAISLAVEGWDGSDWDDLPGFGSLTGGSADLSGVDATTYRKLRLTATLSSTDDNATPRLLRWSVDERVPGGDGTAVASLTCANCHNSHTVGTGAGAAWDVSRISDPLNTKNGAEDVTDFCLSCHSLGAVDVDKNATELVPYRISFSDPVGTLLTGWDKGSVRFGFKSSAHFTTDDTKALCENCHDPHGSDNAALTAWTRPASFAGGVEGTRDNTSSAAFEENLCLQCHGNGSVGRLAPGAPDVATALSSAFGHDVGESGSHVNTETLASVQERRHAECVDCHDPHAAQSGTHVAGTSAGGGALRGAVGVRPTWGTAPASTPTSLTPVRMGSRGDEPEAYLCFKCHSGTEGLPSTETRADGSTYTPTDIAAEFNPNNASFHNVLGLGQGMKSSFVVGGATYTWGLPAAASFLKPGWTTDSGVTCTDCHTSDGMAGAKGPHGSSVRHLIDPAYPADYRQASLDWREPDGVWPTGQVICTKCHVFSPGQNRAHGAYAVLQGSIGNKIHTREYMETMKCTSCHIAIPHGWKRPRLLINSSDPAVYRSPYARGPLANIRLRSRSGPSDWWQSDCQGCGIFAHPTLSPAWP